ncbi:MAG: cobaltochelatase subunit CobN, partial [Oscillospiraceae bacterium]
MKFTFITVSAPSVKCMMKAAKEISRIEPDILDLRLYYAVTEYSKEKTDRLIADIKTSDMVFVDLMGSPVDIVKAVYKGLEECKGNIIPYGNSAREYLKLGSFSAESMKSSGGKKPDMAAMKKMQSMAEAMGKIMPGKMRDMRNYSLICKYFYVADYPNILNMLYLILRDYGGAKRLPKPSEPRGVPAAAVCRPKDMKYYGSFAEFKEDFSYDPNKPVIALLYYGHIYPMDYSGAVSVIMERMQKSANVLPVAVSGSDSLTDGSLQKLLTGFLPQKPEIILNFMSFRLSAGPMGGNISAGTDLLKELNVPYLHPFFMSRRTEREWNESVQGNTPSETLISVMLPEQDGAVVIMPVGAKTEPVYNEEFDVTTDEIQIIDERLEVLTQRTEKYISLRQKKNPQKKVAIICYNYPPGETNVFGGAFLDTFQSVSAMLSLLKENGYDTEDISAEKLMSDFINGGLVNTGKYVESEKMLTYPLSDYKKFLGSFPDKKTVIDAWGEPSGDIMTDENGDFLIPAAMYGNVLVGIQPSRGVHEDRDKLYHDKSIPPHHQYIAFYKYLHDKFRADAVIHVGTHGTLEFLKGKESGMSGLCYPDVLIGDIPHFYLYYCGNPSEATIAKRRSHAALVGYQPPVFIQSGLYGEYAQLSAMLDDYHHQLAFSESAACEVRQNIAALAEKLNMPADMEELESELYRLNSSLIPKGLHIFGQNYSDEEARCYVRELLKKPHDDIPSLNEIAAAELGTDLAETEEKGGEKLREINALAENYFDKYFDGEAVSENLRKTIEYGRKKYGEIKCNAENEQLMNALSGGYIPAKPAGDIYRSPEVLPTGYNLYQFDQRFVPTLTAYQRGARAAENTIKTYYNEYGCYPNMAAVILWGLETSRTQGETIGQIMAYLGARLAKGNSPWNPKYELIPIEELG